MKTKLKLGTAIALSGCLWCGVARGQFPGQPSPPQMRTLSGIVLDEDGKPVPGAYIRVRTGPTNIYTGSDGRFEMTWRYVSLTRATPMVMARHRTRNLVGFAEFGESSNVEVNLRPALTVVVKLQDPEGQPVTNGTAFFAISPGFGDGEWVQDTQVPTDGQGRLMENALPRGMRVRVAIDAPHLARVELSATSNETDVVEYDFPTVTMKRGNLTLAGRVLDPDGNEAAGIKVNVLSIQGQAADSTTSDDHGIFRFEHILPGSVQLSAGGRGVRGFGSGRAGDTGVLIRLTSTAATASRNTTATITGVVLDANGTPAEGVQVMTVPGMPSLPFNPQPQAKTDARGAFSVQWQPPPNVPMGSPSLIARDPAHNLAAVERIGPETTNQNLRLSPGLTIRGKVVDATGHVVPKTTLRLTSRVFMWNDSVERADIPMNESGEFVVTGLPLGALYTFTAQNNGYTLATKAIPEDESQVNLINLNPLVLKPMDRVLAGWVLDADGNPVSGAEIRIANQQRGGAANLDVYTDSKGHFQTMASEDKTRLTAISPSMQKNANVDVVGGDTNVVIRLPPEQ